MSSRHHQSAQDEQTKKRAIHQESAPPQGPNPASIQRAIQQPSSETLTPDVLQSLQRSHGNQYVQRLIQRSQNSTLKKTSANTIQRGGYSTEDMELVGETLGAWLATTRVGQWIRSWLVGNQPATTASGSGSPPASESSPPAHLPPVHQDQEALHLHQAHRLPHL